jgi:SAM-dependent methyltransferase
MIGENKKKILSNMKEMSYDEYYNFLQKRTLKSTIYRKYWLYPRLCKFLTGKVLDVGSGVGDFVKFRPDTVGVDINPDNVQWCQSQDIDIRLMSVNVLPFKDKEFDSINMDNVLEHIKDPELILSEMDRVLKDNGILLVGVPGTLGFETAPDHHTFYSKEDLIKTFVNRGYKVQSVFAMPIEYDWLDSHMEQYCYYGVFKKVSIL